MMRRKRSGSIIAPSTLRRAPRCVRSRTTQSMTELPLLNTMVAPLRVLARGTRRRSGRLDSIAPSPAPDMSARPSALEAVDPHMPVELLLQLEDSLADFTPPGFQSGAAKLGLLLDDLLADLELLEPGHVEDPGARLAVDEGSHCVTLPR